MANSTHDIIAQLKFCAALHQWPIDLLPIIASYARQRQQWATGFADYKLSRENQTATAFKTSSAYNIIIIISSTHNHMLTSNVLCLNIIEAGLL